MYGGKLLKYQLPLNSFLVYTRPLTVVIDKQVVQHSILHTHVSTWDELRDIWLIKHTSARMEEQCSRVISNQKKEIPKWKPCFLKNIRSHLQL